MSKRIQLQFQLWGWVLFVFSALFYIGSSFRAGDFVSLTGGILFLLACLVFLVPLLIELAPALSNLAPRNIYSRYRSGWSRAARCLSRVPVAPMTQLALEHHQQQNRQLEDRLALRFYASTR